MTRVLSIRPEDPDRVAIEEAVRVLRRGGLVAFPTETVYGLGARALDASSLARIFEAKGRPTNHPLIAHVEGEHSARRLAAFWPHVASRLAEAFWPGPLTLVVPRAGSVPSAIAGGGDSIAVRAPRHAVAMALVRALGEPIAAPSANRYQSLSPTRAEHVLRSLEGRIDLVLDGGACREGIESTVVDVRGSVPVVLRPGSLGLGELRGVVPDVVGQVSMVPAGAARPSPGMDDRHYAPRAELRIARDRAEARAFAEEALARGRRVGMMLRTSEGRAGERSDVRVTTRLLPSEPAGYARELFATLHAFDEAGSDVVIVEAVPIDEAWWGVADRLRRAAAR